jgi:lactoylglutathione lyase
VNQKRQVNIYDPEGKPGWELMEASTITGKPTPSSTAPPPKPCHADEPLLSTSMNSDLRY